MAYDGNGTFNRPVADYVFDTVISETDMNTEMSGMATGLSTAITKDGQTTITANIPMNSKKFTGLTAGSATTDSVTLEQVQANAYAFQGTDSGAADAYVIALSPARTSHPAGLRVSFVAANASTGASTLNAGGGNDAIEYQGSALTGAEIAAGSTIVCEADGTAWQMVSPSALLGAGTVTASSTDTFTNKTIDADGTGNVLSNIDIGNAIAASQAEAEAGTDNTKLVTSLRVAEAIAALSTDTFASELLHVRQEQTSGTGGGGAGATTDNICVLNTVLTNEITSATLGSNQISLPAGTYYIDAASPNNKTDANKAFLYNTSDTADEVLGSSGFTPAGDTENGYSFVRGRFTIAGTKVFELRHYTATARATDGLGFPATSGQTEVFQDVRIWKVG